MKQTIKLCMLAAILTLCGSATQAQTKRSDAASQPAVIYNLQGQRLNSPQRGINIVGGEKMFVE